MSLFLTMTLPSIFEVWFLFFLESLCYKVVPTKLGLYLWFRKIDHNKLLFIKIWDFRSAVAKAIEMFAIVLTHSESVLSLLVTTSCVTFEVKNCLLLMLVFPASIFLLQWHVGAENKLFVLWWQICSCHTQCSALLNIKISDGVFRDLHSTHHIGLWWYLKNWLIHVGLCSNRSMVKFGLLGLLQEAGGTLKLCTLTLAQPFLVTGSQALRLIVACPSWASSRIVFIGLAGRAGRRAELLLCCGASQASADLIFRLGCCALWHSSQSFESLHPQLTYTLHSFVDFRSPRPSIYEIPCHIFKTNDCKYVCVRCFEKTLSCCDNGLFV